MTPRAVLRLSSWWSPCSGKVAQIGRSGNDSSVVWTRCGGGGSPDTLDELPLSAWTRGERRSIPPAWRTTSSTTCWIESSFCGPRTKGRPGLAIPALCRAIWATVVPKNA